MLEMFKASPSSPPMFENEFIDKFSRVHAALVPIIFVPATLATLAMGIMKPDVQTWLAIIMVPAGFFAWTFAEYWLHRTVFHWIPKAKWGERFHFVLHGVHHKWPKDKYRLVMPPAVSIGLFFPTLYLWLWTFGVHGWFFHAGFVIGYITYDMTHYFVHHHRPKSKRFKRIARHHMLHHFSSAHREMKYGVSTTLWDRVFGTMKDSSSSASSQRA